MRVTVCFGQTRVIVPCKGGATVAELVKEACSRYKKATGKGPKYWVRIRQLENAVDGGILDGDDYVYDVAEDRDQLVAIFEEEDQAYRYNGWDHTNGGPSADVHRSPRLFQQHHQPVNIQYGDEKSSGNRRHTSAPTGNATVIKQDKRDSELEVHVGAEALKSNSNSNITVRDPMVTRNEDGPKSLIKKHYYGKRESGSGQEEDHLTATVDPAGRPEMNSIIEHNARTATSSSDAKISTDDGQSSKNIYESFSGKNEGNFVRGTTRQSTMGMLAENDFENTRLPPDGRKQNSFDVDDPSTSYRTEYRAEQYLPPPPEDPSIYPRFYNDSQEMFVDIDNRLLGIQVTSYRERKVFLGLIVKSVDKDGRSEREGLLQQGDVIVEINNYILAQYNLTISQEIFKDAMKFSELQLRVYPIEERERTFSGDAAVDTSTTLSKHRHTPSIPVLSVVKPTPPKENKISAAKSLPDLNAPFARKVAQDANPTGKLPLIARMSLDTLSNNTRKIGNMFEIELKKGEQGLGFSITTRDTPVGDPGPIYIKNVLPKGAAIQDGRLHAGDRLLKVDDIELTGHTQESAVNILRCIGVGSVVKLVVSRHMNTLPRKMKDDPVTDKVIGDDRNREYFEFEIALNDTGSAGLGISLKGNQSKKTKRDLGIFVKSVFRGGAAYQDGRLQPNDQLVLVNGQSLIGMTNHEAIDTLRTSMSTVGNVRGMIQMVIARRKPRAGMDKTVPQFSSEASSEVSDSLVNERSSKTSFEITGNPEENSVDGSYQYNEEIPRQIDPNPIDDTHSDPVMYNGKGGEWTPSPDPHDPEVDPFSRESIFRQSISEKRKGAASRDAQITDTFKALKSKQLNLEIADKKPASMETTKHSTPAVSTPLKWVKPTSTNHSSKSTLPSRRSPGMAKRNLNNSSNLPARAAVGNTVEPEVEVGPTLGIAKSSSLESLQTAVENYVEGAAGPFPKPQSRVLRGRVLNESFRAALDQSYDLDGLSGKPMSTLREEGDRNGPITSPLAKSGDGRQPRTHEKKRAGKSYKIFGIFRVGKNKRSLSSDRNLDSHSSSSSSPHLTESEVHKKLLEAKREDDYKKHQAETERIQAKAKVMREQQEQKKKDEVRYKSREDLVDSGDRIRAPSVPVTAMQRMSPDPKVSYSESRSGRQSVDPTAMRNSHQQTFEWHTSKRPTSPVDYSEQSRHNRSRPEKKSSVNKPKLNPDYSSLPRQSRLEPNAKRIQDGPDGTLVSEPGRTTGPPTSPSRRTAQPPSSYPGKRQTGNGFDNHEFYNMQKPPGSKKPSTGAQSHESAKSQRQGRFEKPKAGRTLYYDDVGDSVSTSPHRSKTPQPRGDAAAEPKPRPASTIPHDDFRFAVEEKTFHREDSPEPPPTVVRRNQHHPSAPAAGSYRHSVHIDAPATRKTDRHQATTRSRSRKQTDPPSFKWKAHIQRHNNHDQSDSDSSSPASSSAAERNRDALKKILNQNRYSGRHASESIVISPPYNL